MSSKQSEVPQLPHRTLRETIQLIRAIIGIPLLGIGATVVGVILILHPIEQIPGHPSPSDRNVGFALTAGGVLVLTCIAVFLWFAYRSPPERESDAHEVPEQ